MAANFQFVLNLTSSSHSKTFIFLARMFIPLELMVSVDVPIIATTRNFGLSQTDTLHRPRMVSSGLVSFRNVDYLLVCLLRAARLLPALLVYISMLADVHVWNLWIRCKAYGNNLELVNFGLVITPKLDRTGERLLTHTLRYRPLPGVDYWVCTQ